MAVIANSVFCALGCSILCAVLAAQAQAFDCGRLQGAWNARMELKASGRAYSAEEGYPIEANNDIYKAYIQELLLTDEGRELCLADDPMVRILNPLYRVLHEEISVEEFSATLLADSEACDVIWELDPIVGRDSEFRDAFIHALGNTPVFLIGDLLTASIGQDTDATLQLWLKLFDNADGMYAEEFWTNWIYQLLRDKPEVVMSRMDYFMPREAYIISGCCVGIVPEENAELTAIYEQYADNPNARIVLDWLACEEAEQ